MARNINRPLSPHLTIWKWGPHMLVSILHRATGVALSIAGLALLTWWLLAIAGGGDGYKAFTSVATHPLGILVLFGLTWAFFQHTASGIRHLVMDTGAGFELNTNKKMAYATLAASLLLTVALWAYILLVRA
jgi:succinate dehydrogenase / fumarate reductase cytochrome b subunit